VRQLGTGIAVFAGLSRRIGIGSTGRFPLYDAALGRLMYLVDLREYLKDKAWAIGIGLALIGIVLTLTAFQGLVWMSAATALSFLGVYPVVNTINRWHLYSRGERIFNVGMNTFLLVDLGYLVIRDLASKGVHNLGSAFGLTGIDVVLALTFILLWREVPKWAQSRKKCPECFQATDVAARACSCGYRWPVEHPEAEVA
jgi:hypothetical protein